MSTKIICDVCSVCGAVVWASKWNDHRASHAGGATSVERFALVLAQP